MDFGNRLDIYARKRKPGKARINDLSSPGLQLSGNDGNSLFILLPGTTVDALNQGCGYALTCYVRKQRVTIAKANREVVAACLPALSLLQAEQILGGQ